VTSLFLPYLWSLRHDSISSTCRFVKVLYKLIDGVCLWAIFVTNVSVISRTDGVILSRLHYTMYTHNMAAATLNIDSTYQITSLLLCL